MGKTKCLDVGMSIRRRSTRGVPSTSHNDEVFELEVDLGGDNAAFDEDNGSGDDDDEVCTVTRTVLY